MTPAQEKAAQDALGETLSASLFGSGCRWTSMSEPGWFVFVVMQPSGGFMRCMWPAERARHRHVFGNDAGRADWVRAIAPPGWSVRVTDEEIIFEKATR